MGGQKVQLWVRDTENDQSPHEKEIMKGQADENKIVVTNVLDTVHDQWWIERPWKEICLH